MLANKDLHKLRKQWFRLKAQEFIARYWMGIVILVVFLPGVGVGENFNMLLSVLTKPFAIISDGHSAWFLQQKLLFLLIVIFVVWARAQRSAINGGNFMQYLESLPIKKITKNAINLKILLIGNHLLWPIIIVSYFYLASSEGSFELLNVIRNTFIIIFLLSIQYVSVFQVSIKNIVVIFAIGLLFTLQLELVFEIYRLLIVYSLLFLFIYYQLYLKLFNSPTVFKFANLLPKIFQQNLQLQILFRSGLTSTLFRLVMVVGLMIIFALAKNSMVSDTRELTPYYMTLEAILAYLISSFFVSFDDQRILLKPWLATLPLKKHFWFIKDYSVVTLLSLLIHLPFYWWASNITNMNLLFNMFVYHLFLLAICYPIRTLMKNHQTLVAFVVLFIITAISIFNLS
ncbi:MAG: hypothetical protein L3J53_08005 [Proteobacteria bacterium]|nr:hypothetical protein [Pseudomonadota bacterium]